jgi:hypothetical protein
MSFASKRGGIDTDIVLQQRYAERISAGAEAAFITASKQVEGVMIAG